MALQKFIIYENGNVVAYSGHKREPITGEKNGNKEKTYTIGYKEARKIASSAVRLWALRRYKLIFVTLTFSEKIDEKEANKCWSKFIDNLKKTYKLENYVAVKELHVSGNPHFHAIFDIPFIPIARLNDAWVATWPSGFSPSSCAVRLPPKTVGSVVKSQRSLVRYLSKYVSKCGGTRRGGGLDGERDKSVGQNRGTKYGIGIKLQSEARNDREVVISGKSFGRKHESDTSDCRTEEKGTIVYKAPCIFISRQVLSKPRIISSEEFRTLTREKKTKKEYRFKYSTITCFEEGEICLADFQRLGHKKSDITQNETEKRKLQQKKQNRAIERNITDNHYRQWFFEGRENVSF